MAIYLDEQTRPYLERVLKSSVKDSDFIGKRIIKMLEADRERLRLLGECEHERGLYRGKKACCVKCGGNAFPGDGELWELTTETVGHEFELEDYQPQEATLF